MSSDISRQASHRKPDISRQKENLERESIEFAIRKS